jgi:hypothetical protein
MIRMFAQALALLMFTNPSFVNGRRFPSRIRVRQRRMGSLCSTLEQAAPGR